MQALLVVALETLTGANRTGTETPADMDTNLPFVRVRRTAPGSSDQVTDTGTLAVDVFTALYTDGVVLAENIREWLVGPPPPVREFDYVECSSAPQELPWATASPVRRINTVYRVEARRRAA
jgi:hypothetical protein